MLSFIFPGPTVKSTIESGRICFGIYSLQVLGDGEAPSSGDLADARGEKQPAASTAATALARIISVGRPATAAAAAARRVRWRQF